MNEWMDEWMNEWMIERNMASGSFSRFSLVESINGFIEAQENNNTQRKTKGDLLVLVEFLKTVKDETREVENIPLS